MTLLAWERREQTLARRSRVRLESTEKGGHMAKKKARTTRAKRAKAPKRMKRSKPAKKKVAKKK